MSSEKARMSVAILVTIMFSYFIKMQEEDFPEYLHEIKEAVAKGEDDFLDQHIQKNWSCLSEHACASLKTTVMTSEEGSMGVFSRKTIRKGLIEKIKERYKA